MSDSSDTSVSWLEARAASTAVRLSDDLHQQRGAWSDASWRARHLPRVLPQLPELLEQLTLCMPPLSSDASVGLVQCASASLVAHSLRGVLESKHTLHVLCERAEWIILRAAWPAPPAPAPVLKLYPPPSADDSQRLTAAPDRGFHVLVSILPSQLQRTHDASSTSAWLRMLHSSLCPGGHVFLGGADQSAASGASSSVLRLMLALQEVGFIDADVVWKRDGLWLIGARKPVKAAIAASRSLPTASVPIPSAAAIPVSIPPAKPVASSTSSTAPAEDVESWPVIDSSAVLAAAAVEPSAATAATAVSAPASSSSSSSSSAARPAQLPAELPAHLVSKLPLLFRRFDPAQTGLLSYAALCSLCRAVGRPVPEDEDEESEESLWWTYQSLASTNPDSGCTGISIEDLSEHFYRNGGWDLEHDLRVMRII